METQCECHGIALTWGQVWMLGTQMPLVALLLAMRFSEMVTISLYSFSENKVQSSFNLSDNYIIGKFRVY